MDEKILSTTGQENIISGDIVFRVRSDFTKKSWRNTYLEAAYYLFEPLIKSYIIIASKVLKKPITFELREK